MPPLNKKRVKDICPYRYDATWVGKDSLGKLISKFEMINENDKLIKKIKKHIPKRNELAHKSMLFAMHAEENQSYKDEKTNELIEMHNVLTNIFTELLVELKKIHQIQNSI